MQDLELQLLEHGMTPVYQPEIWATQPPPKAITDISDVRSFLGRPAPEGCAPIQCFVQRQYKADWIFPRYLPCSLYISCFRTLLEVVTLLTAFIQLDLSFLKRCNGAIGSVKCVNFARKY